MLLVLAMAPLVAVETRRLPAPEANQGAAADATAVYAIDNSAIARYDRRSGRLLARWTGDPVRFKHINSCTVHARELVCAASNYPRTPMTSQLVRFDARSLRLLGTHPLGHSYGSLTWADWHGGNWWLCYANYDRDGGEPGRDHRATMLVRYDAKFVEQAHYAFPETVLARFAPRSASGGAWGRDDLLYVTGHDRPELYVLRIKDGALAHIATIATPTGGQAIGWQPGARILWSIDRTSRQLVASQVPPVAD